MLKLAVIAESAASTAFIETVYSFGVILLATLALVLTPSRSPANRSTGVNFAGLNALRTTSAMPYFATRVALQRFRSFTAGRVS